MPVDDTTDALRILGRDTLSPPPEDQAAPPGLEGEVPGEMPPGGQSGIAACEMLDCIYNNDGMHEGEDIIVGPSQKCETYQKREGGEGEALSDELNTEAPVNIERPEDTPVL